MLRAHRRSLSTSTIGFTYPPERDIWRCPQDQHLFPVFSDHVKGVIVYRAPAAACNTCKSKAACTTSDRGREIERKDLNPGIRHAALPSSVLADTSDSGPPDSLYRILSRCRPVPTHHTHRRVHAILLHRLADRKRSHIRSAVIHPLGNLLQRALVILDELPDPLGRELVGKIKAFPDLVQI